MADDNETDPTEIILYELLVLSEWIEDYDSVVSKNAFNSSIQESVSYLNPWKLFRKSIVDNLRFFETEYQWHLAVSKDGKVLAVLQETLLEIKTAKDEFLSVVGKASIPNDQFPKMRKMTWSPDNSFVAVGRDNGIVMIFNLFGCNIATIEPANNDTSVIRPVVGLHFLQPKFDSTKWSNELLIVYHKGDIKSLRISPLVGYETEENMKYSFESCFPQGISSTAYSPNHLLVVSGSRGGNECDITVWRILNDYPYLKNAFDCPKNSVSSRSFFKYFFSYPKKISDKIIKKMIISPNHNLLACLDFSGEISIWRMPKVLLEKKWSLEEQPSFNRSNPQKHENPTNKCFHPVDISWWSDSALVIARKNGALSICSITTLRNLLGDSPEFCAGSLQISSVQGERSEVIALECETANLKSTSENNEIDSGKDVETSLIQASIHAALYSVTENERFEPKRKLPKVIQRTYRLLALKRRTPEELYSRKIDNEEYEEALALAKKYNLDCDLVYQKRWRISPANKDSIYDYLDKVSKTVWVVKECLERVPQSMDDAKELLEFGLKKTSLKKLQQSKLNAEEQQLVSFRRQLFKFLDSLTIYEIMIGYPHKYNSKEYDDFRKKPTISATVDFARNGNWQAVSIMFTFVGNKVLPHWLPILSNFPETLKPLHYQSLLPEIVAGEVIPWEVEKLRDLDWSEKSVSESSDEDDKEGNILYQQDPLSKEFQCQSLTESVVEKWYKMRAYEIEKKTGLVENALKFVVLAKERGIKVLNELHHNLLTLEGLVYLVGDDNFSLSKLEKLNHLEQCILLLSKTTKLTFMNDLKNLIVPFCKRCQLENCHSAETLLKSILLHYSEESLDFPLELLNYLKEGYINPLMLTLNSIVFIVLDCIYHCPKVNQLETCFLILECLPQRTNNMPREDVLLHDRIDKLEIHLQVCEVLNRYEIPKSVRFLKENEDDINVGKQLMQSMADYTKRETLDFSDLLSNLQFIKSQLFSSIPDIYCFEICALSQLSCECEEIIDSAENILQVRKSEKGKMISFEKSVELVLKAAKSHFEKAVNFDDHYIQLAQTCLKLIGEPHPLIYEELDLIEALQLLGDFDVKILPLQVRKHDNRKKLIESCLKAKPKNYKACQRLLQLAQTLRICGENRSQREGEILMLIAEYALSCSDYQYCSEICNRLINRNYSSAWTIIRLLAQEENYENKDNRKLFFAFAILHCPVENLEELIESRVELHQKHFI